MTLEDLKNHVRFLIERDNSDVTEDSFEMDMRILLKYILQIEESTKH
jgi:hypothetical protein